MNEGKKDLSGLFERISTSFKVSHKAITFRHKILNRCSPLTTGVLDFSFTFSSSFPSFAHICEATMCCPWLQLQPFLWTPPCFSAHPKDHQQLWMANASTVSLPIWHCTQHKLGLRTPRALLLMGTLQNNGFPLCSIESCWKVTGRDSGAEQVELWDGSGLRVPPTLPPCPSLWPSSRTLWNASIHFIEMISFEKHGCRKEKMVKKIDGLTAMFETYYYLFLMDKICIYFKTSCCIYLWYTCFEIRIHYGMPKSR